MGYEFVSAMTSASKGPGDNDAGVLTSGGNSRTTAIVHQYEVSVGHWRRDGY